MDERRANCEAHMEKTEELRKCIFGNGRPGLAYEMVSVKTRLNILITLNIGIVGSMIAYIFTK